MSCYSSAHKLLLFPGAEFDELSDIDGDDSAVISQCNSSLSWTSLDAKQSVLCLTDILFHNLMLFGL